MTSEKRLTAVSRANILIDGLRSGDRCKSGTADYVAFAVLFGIDEHVKCDCLKYAGSRQHTCLSGAGGIE